MPGARPLIVTVIITAIAVAACSPTTPGLSPSPASFMPSPSPSQGAPSSPPPSSEAASAAPASGAPATSEILARGSARELSAYPVMLAPARDGSLFIEVPSRSAGSAVLTRFDSTGRSLPGWPVTLTGATYCDAPLPVGDDSVRILCTVGDIDSGSYPSPRAFAFNAAGRGLPGWPVDIDGVAFSGTLVDDKLGILVTLEQAFEDEGPAPWQVLLIGADGAIDRPATSVPMGWWPCCEMAAVGPDGVAYAVSLESAQGDSRERSRIIAIDQQGIRSRWPVTVDGVASSPAFSADGSIVLLSASPNGQSSRVLRLDAAGAMVKSRSAALPFAAAEPQRFDTGGCVASIPEPPQIAGDGTLILYSEVDSQIFAVDPALQPAEGWPFVPSDSLVTARPGLEIEHEAGYCPGPVAPVIGPDGTVYLALQAHDSSVGGSLLAVGRDGRVRPGWPVELKRAESEFWSVAVGADGTAYAIAFESEAGATSSATLLAIAPDSTVRYRTTIIAPG